ncbi:MAG: hypothetical protein DIU78_008550 [Pseudomonadota bacterium]
MTEPTPKCPKCGSDRVVPILYGEPTQEAEAMVRRGEAVHYGCMVGGDMPTRLCRDCGNEFEIIRWGRD